MDLEELALGLGAAVAAVLTRAAGILHLAFVQLQQEQKPGFETCSDQRDFSYAMSASCRKNDPVDDYIRDLTLGYLA